MCRKCLCAVLLVRCRAEWEQQRARDRQEYKQLIDDAVTMSRQLEDALHAKESELRTAKGDSEELALQLKRCEGEVVRLTDAIKVPQQRGDRCYAAHTLSLTRALSFLSLCYTLTLSCGRPRELEPGEGIGMGGRAK